jgi:ABC-type multidrug transport system fused ATPase/permease subunit
MARALLRRPRILVLDEATASVDAETDAAIQRCVRTRLAGCTRLTIAHRLHTIMDSDRILVMRAGVVGEADTPSALAGRAGSLLSGLIDETGVESAAYLRGIATQRGA